jgi:hypothetical protein
MSAIATFYLLPTDKLIGLREVWPDTFAYRQKYAEEYFADYDWSGYCIASVFHYLKERKDIDLSKSDYHLLFPGAYEDATWFLDKPLKQKYLKRFDSKLLPDKELRANLFDWFGLEDDCAKAVTDGLQLIRKSLQMVNTRRVMLVHVG